MNLDERQYERIARFIDGEDVPLDEDERSAAEEMLYLEGRNRDLMEVSTPDTSMRLARQAMLDELRKSRTRRSFRRAVTGLAGLAAAAVITLVIGVHWMNNSVTSSPRQHTGGDDITHATYFALVHQADDDLAISMLEDEIELFEAELLASTRSQMDWRMDSVQDQIDTFWFDDVDLSLWNNKQM